jgi:TRAP-type C4-dicarboxylate transport system permease small subunit
MTGLKKLNELLVYSFTFVGGITLVLMMVIACTNMVMRLVGNPIAATYEIVGYLSALTVSLPLGYSQLKKSHIAVDILTSRFSPAIQRFISVVGLLLGIVFFFVASWQVGVYAQTLRHVGEVSETLRFPHYPFVFGVAVSCGVMTICLAVDLLTLIVPSKEQRD